jgi:hypothetical protein
VDEEKVTGMAAYEGLLRQHGLDCCYGVSSNSGFTDLPDRIYSPLGVFYKLDKEIVGRPTYKGNVLSSCEVEGTRCADLLGRGTGRFLI